MHPVAEFFRKLFSTEGFPARWNCGTWTDFHGWLYIVGDLLIWSAYFAIPLIIVMYISRRRNELRFQRIYLLFASFILACGSTHLIDALIFWQPVYRFSALVRVATGIISWVTVFYLVKALPTAFSLKSPRELEKEVVHRKAAEQELMEKNALLATAQGIAKLGYWRFDVASGSIIWSDEMYRIFGISIGSPLTYDGYISAVHPADRSIVQQQISTALQTGNYPGFHHRIITPSGEVKHLKAAGEAVLGSSSDAVAGLTGTAQDVTAQRTAELQIIAKSKQLERINAELESFAYVASHDLQEPLRKVLTFSNLLEGELNGSASPDAQLYLQKIALSASRMQRLIQDILQFSRLAQPEDFKKTNLGEVVHQAVADAEVRITETGAKVDFGSLPIIEAVPSQMGQLFANLLSNALKYAKPGQQPHVHIRADEISGADLSEEEIRNLAYYDASRSPTDWAAVRFSRIYVRDEGIGFEAEYAAKIFAIFQRLHGRDAYDGTGIGLAVSKKIVENHHGLIEARSTPGEGATFIITLPVSQESFSNMLTEAADATLEAA